LILEQRLGNLERAFVMRDAESRGNAIPSYRAHEPEQINDWNQNNGEIGSTTGKFGADLESS